MYSEKGFYVRNLSCLRGYGFSSKSNGDYWWERKRTIALCVDGGNGRVSIWSASKDAIALLCEMYKNGDLEIITESRETHYMKLTDEEIKVIEERRRNGKV